MPQFITPTPTLPVPLADDIDEEPPSAGAADESAQDFLEDLLAALAQMATLSPRRQADVAVAMRRARLRATPEAIHTALDELLREGCLERPLHLSDGGIPVAVTARGIERLATTVHRHIVAALITPRGF